MRSRVLHSARSLYFPLWIIQNKMPQFHFQEYTESGIVQSSGEEKETLEKILAEVLRDLSIISPPSCSTPVPGRVVRIHLGPAQPWMSYLRYP